MQRGTQCAGTWCKKMMLKHDDSSSMNIVLGSSESNDKFEK